MLGGLLLAVSLLAATLVLSGGLGGVGSGPQVAVAGCSGVKGTVEVASRFPKAFASQYKKKLKIRVYNRTGNVKKWHLELYTYSGYKLGSSKEKKWLTWGNKASIRLRQAMQPGGYTVVLKGEIPGCGSSEMSDSIRLRGCLNKLPIKFPDKPGGKRRRLQLGRLRLGADRAPRLVGADQEDQEHPDSTTTAPSTAGPSCRAARAS